ncbi:hypothetical protein CR513_12309, partial [Mucuna pruriens]
MVISVITADYKIERVLIDQEEQVEIKGMIEIKTVFGAVANAHGILVTYIVVIAWASYNVIIGHLALNKLRAIMSTSHLWCVVWADKIIARRCYEDSLRVGPRPAFVSSPKTGMFSHGAQPTCQESTQNFLCHRLSISPRTKPVVQKKRRLVEEKRKATKEETNKLLTTGFIKDLQYPTWLANVVMVRKFSGKLRMCTDYTNLNKA